MTGPPPLSELPPPSLATLEIPILENYPPEILTVIFSLIHQSEIKLEFPKLAPYYLPIKYRKIDLIGGRAESLLPAISDYLLPIYLEAAWFHPEFLRINTSEQFTEYPEHLLEKIKAIDIRCSIKYYGDAEKLSKMENIIDNLSKTIEPVPDGPLTRLVLKYNRIDFLVKFPVSLVHLDVGSRDIPEYTNLGYLINLRTLYLGLIKNVELPTTIRDLTCRTEIDFTRFLRLEFVEVGDGDGLFSFPETIRHIQLNSCTINALGNLPGLSKLEYLGISYSEVNLKLLEVKYPQGLKRLYLHSIRSINLRVRFNALPKGLEEFKLHWANRRGRIFFECIWPESVRRIELHRVFIKSLARQNIDIIDGDSIKWPLQLEYLTLTGMNPENISLTNIVKLNLKVFNVGQDEFRTQETLRNVTSSKQLAPELREFTLNSGLFEPSANFFSGSTLTLLTLTECKIHASSPVQLPSTLRVITITKCDLTSEVWSKFVCPPNLKTLDLLNNELTVFVKCSPKLEELNLRNNKLTTFGKINECLTEIALEGNYVPADVIPEYSSKRLSKTLFYGGIEILTHYNNVDEIGLVYTIEWSWRQYHYLVVSKNGVRRLDVL